MVTPLTALPTYRPAQLVSIVVSNYNYGRFLDACLQSAAGQTTPCEVVVVDDGSTDESQSILDRWDGQVKVIRQANQGQIAAYHTGFEHSSGDLVIFLDSDDVLDREAAATILATLRPHAAKAHFRLRLIDADGRPTGASIPTRMADGDQRRSLLQKGLLHASAPGSGNVYRREVLQRLFPLPTDPNDKHGADFFCCYGSAAIGPVQAIEETLGGYRVHQRAQATTDSGNAPLLFGNAERSSTIEARLAGRELRLRQWLAAHGMPVTSARLLDFSFCKVSFARAATAEGSLWQRWRAARAQWPDFLRTLFGRDEVSMAFKLALTGWAFAVVLLPRPLALRAAVRVCNPAQR